MNSLSKILHCLALIVICAGCSSDKNSDQEPASVVEAVNDVSFDWFEYSGGDSEFEQDLDEGHYFNPILAGYNPDPSIVRVGEDYYLVNSSFAHWPGLPIYHSKDLVNWQQIGHGLERTEQLDLAGIETSHGIYAPTIRYHEGVFYIITTAVYSGGNFIITSEDPAGPWSKPVFLPEVGGIDPDLFFDDDGRVYVSHNDEPEGEPLYGGHRALWMWELDLAAMKVLPDSRRLLVNGGVNIEDEPIWTEGPHIYKKDGWYYLTAAEGGTGPNHSQTIFRARNLEDEFVPYENNPILTQRDLDPARPDPIVNAGHADFVQTQHGEWWAVFLASRAYGNGLHNVGRETFLLPVEWRDEWPHILPAGEAIPYRHKRPSGFNSGMDLAPLTGNFDWKDDFDGTELALIWKSLRGPFQDWASVQDGALVITPRSELLTGLQVPSFIGRKQQHENFEARLALDTTFAAGRSAGMAAYQNSKFHYFLALRPSAEGAEVFLEQVAKGESKVLASKVLDQGRQQVIMGMEGRQGLGAFYIENAKGERDYLIKDADLTLLSTNVAGGFVGAHIGMYARIEQ
jgi:xylan 1,4-beta-xylosidase